MTIGAIDDIVTLRAYVKLIFQIAAAVIARPARRGNHGAV